MKQTLKKNWLGLWSLFIVFLGLASCKEQMDEVLSPSLTDELVTVSLNFGFAEDSGDANGSPTARQRLANGSPTARVESSDAAFNASRDLSVVTRSSTEVPDQLYNLEIRQYDQSGNHLAGKDYSSTSQGIGTKLDVVLRQSDDCQLVVVARGSSRAVSSLGTKTLTEVQKMNVSSSVINAINPSVAGSMNAMPYVLHLEHVKVTSDGKLQSIDGAHDARLLLKRLAARLTVNWNYNVAGYKLNQLLLQSIPLNFTVVEKPDDQDGTYPSLVSQFTTLVVPVTDANAANGSYSCWVPANVRGESAAATSDLQRTKANAPTGSAFFNFVAVNTTDGKKKLDYRVYVGSGASTDFNMHHNKDYVYQVDFNHVGIPTGDRRVTYIDPIPASEGNDNLVPTANCFMVAPGSAFCFDPFKYRKAGGDITNTDLQNWANGSRNGIASVKVLWQTRENGDIGDPILGIANSAVDHTNIVDIRRMDGRDIAANPVADPDVCRIYCRIANTAGGNGVIAAYDQSGAILWSWHIWATDYNPDSHGDETITEPVSKRKQKYNYHTNRDQLPMMDRSLGALGGYTDVPTTELDKSKANGMHYQWGRKDPFLGSFTNEVMQSVTIVSGDTSPTYGLLNAYGPDGYTFCPRIVSNTRVTIEKSTKNPTIFYSERPWYLTDSNYWGDSTEKTIYDPCPSGWKIPQCEDYSHFFSTVRYDGNYVSQGSWTDNTTLRSKPGNSDGTYWKKGSGAGVWNDGGVVLYYDTDNSHTTYFRFTGYHEYSTSFNYIGRFFCIWSRGHKGQLSAGFAVDWSAYRRLIYQSWESSDGHNVRCIQEER